MKKIIMKTQDKQTSYCNPQKTLSATFRLLMQFDFILCLTLDLRQNLTLCKCTYARNEF